MNLQLAFSPHSLCGFLGSLFYLYLNMQLSFTLEVMLDWIPGLLRLLVMRHQENLARRQGRSFASSITMSRNHGLWCKDQALFIGFCNYMVASKAFGVRLTVDIGLYHANYPGYYATKVAALRLYQILSSRRRVGSLYRGECKDSVTRGPRSANYFLVTYWP